MSTRGTHFSSYIQAGFECSTHKLQTGKRLDLLSSTKHDQWALEDFQRLKKLGITTVRTCARWPRIEQSEGHYDFASLESHLDAAREVGIELLVDLLHFGWPDHIEIFSPAFLSAFHRYVFAFAKFIKPRVTTCTTIAPVNEISFFSWAGADVKCINPYEANRSHELKRILVRAAIGASEILLNEIPGVRLLSPEPVIHIVGDPNIPGDQEEAERYRLAQFQAWDMISGRLAPELGGKAEYLDIIGTNFYSRNEWVHNSLTSLHRCDSKYRPFHLILDEVWRRYRRPILVSETGTEDDDRADWFAYVAEEVALAHSFDIPVHGICLYPILNHPGWDDDRHCHNGLFDYADEFGNREIYLPLANAIKDQQHKLLKSYQTLHASEQHRSDLFVSSQMGFRVSASSAPNEQVRQESEGVLR